MKNEQQQMKEEEEVCWTCGDTDVKHKTYRDALDEYELTCNKCHRIEYPEEYEEEQMKEEEEVCCVGCNIKVCSYDEEPPHKDSRDEAVCNDCWEEEEEEEYEYCNYGTQTEPRFGEMSYMVAGGGMMNGNAYATIELKDGLYYYCEYGNYPKRQSVGNKIVWSDEFYDKQNPYCSRNFNILDVEEE